MEDKCPRHGCVLGGFNRSPFCLLCFKETRETRQAQSHETLPRLRLNIEHYSRLASGAKPDDGPASHWPSGVPL